jgi:hypothetical protein
VFNVQAGRGDHGQGQTFGDGPYQTDSATAVRIDKADGKLWTDASVIRHGAVTICRATGTSEWNASAFAKNTRAQCSPESD